MADKNEEYVYRVTKQYGKRKVGEILPESREARRKIQEGGCIEKISKSAIAKERAEAQKMQADTSKNKMISDEDVKNKSGGK